MALADALKQEIEGALRGILYEEKTLDLIDDTLTTIRNLVNQSHDAALGKNWIVSYVDSGLPPFERDEPTGQVSDEKRTRSNILVFSIAHRDSETKEYVVDLVTLGPATWEERKIVNPDDPDETTD